MAENSTKAFGRYLKALRERRDLSLDEVASLSQTFPEKINKGYLSRCENGHQKLGFSKVIALSRIYEVPADVLVERMELDLELDRVGGPDTEGKTFAELTEAGKRALGHGRLFAAYGHLRDSVIRAPLDPVKSSFRDRDEQIVVAQMNCGTAARSLGRNRFALHEFLYLKSTGAFGPDFYPLILERISVSYRASANLSAAEEYANRAIAKAEDRPDYEYLGFVYNNRAHIAFDRTDMATAIAFYKQAYDTFDREKSHGERALVLNNLSQCYFDLKRYGAARRACEAAEKISKRHGLLRSQAYSLILLGELDEIENRPSQAIRRWRRAVEIAKSLRDRELRFKVEFVLYRRAVAAGDAAVARAIRRRLRRLMPWITPDTHELGEFTRMIQQDNQIN